MKHKRMPPSTVPVSLMLRCTVAAVATEEMIQQNEVEMVELVSTFDFRIGYIRMLFSDTSLEDLGRTVLLVRALEVEQGALVLSLRVIRVVMVAMQGTPELQAEEEVAVQHRL
jgi:hypothetical protein